MTFFIPGATTTTVGDIPSGARLASTWPIMGRPVMACITFGKVDFIRVPLPAARMTAAALASAMIGLINLLCARRQTATARPHVQVAKSAWQEYGTPRPAFTLSIRALSSLDPFVRVAAARARPVHTEVRLAGK